MPQQRKKEGSERLRGERDQIKFINADKSYQGSKLDAYPLVFVLV